MIYMYDFLSWTYRSASLPFFLKLLHMSHLSYNLVPHHHIEEWILIFTKEPLVILVVSRLNVYFPEGLLLESD